MAHAADAPLAADNHASLPIFYKRPVPIEKRRHANKALVRGPQFGFARSTNAIPVTLAELARAQRFFPIVFTSGPQPMPVAIVGLRQDENLFVDAAGHWEAGTYIPEYVRRYPFILMHDSTGGRFYLCVDEDSDLVTDAGPDSDPLFQAGEQTDLTRRALADCATFQQRHESTMAFAKALQNAGLLVDRAATIELKSGEKLALRGFSVIDVDRFDALTEETFLTWRKPGWIAATYLALASTEAWAGLVDRTAARAVRPATGKSNGASSGARKR